MTSNSARRGRRLLLLVVPLVMVGVLARGLTGYFHKSNGTAVQRSHHPTLRPMPAFGTLPTTAAAAHARMAHVTNSSGQICHYAYLRGSRRKVVGRLWVDPQPTGGRALWLPGMNNRPCRARLTRFDAEQAAAFATAVEQAPRIAPGNYACPNDDRRAVVVFLTYPGEPRPEMVSVPLGGCAWISAPGRTARQGGSTITNLIKPFPPGFTGRPGF